MKKYKKNITIKIACVFTECMICTFSMTLIMLLILAPEKLNKFIEILVALFLLTVVVDLLLYIISLIEKLFIKTIYIIDNEKLIVRRKNKEEVIDLKSVNAITYDLGNLTK